MRENFGRLCEFGCTFLTLIYFVLYRLGVVLAAENQGGRDIFNKMCFDCWLVEKFMSVAKEKGQFNIFDALSHSLMYSSVIKIGFI